MKAFAGVNCAELYAFIILLNPRVVLCLISVSLVSDWRSLNLYNSLAITELSNGKFKPKSDITVSYFIPYDQKFFVLVNSDLSFFSITVNTFLSFKKI